MKKIFFLCLAGAVIAAGGIYFGFTKDKLEVENPIPKNNLVEYASEYFPGLKFKYPKFYSIQDGAKAFKVLTASKNADNKIEIFNPAKIDYRSIPVEPKEKYTKKLGGEEFAVWIYYLDTDQNAQSELHQIYNSIEMEKGQI